MNRLRKGLFAQLITGVSVLLAMPLGCSRDFVVQPPLDLAGEYEGVLLYTRDLGTPSEYSVRFPITWEFSDQNWQLWDNAVYYCMCEPSGDYTVTEGIFADSIELIITEYGCGGCVFDTEKLPYGKFLLRRPSFPITSVDSLVMLQIIEGVKKEIRLVPANN